MPRAGPVFRSRHCAAPKNRPKADFARVFGLSARPLFPESAARCAVDPSPIFRYSLTTQEKSSRHAIPTSGRTDKTVGVTEKLYTPNAMVIVLI